MQRGFGQHDGLRKRSGEKLDATQAPSSDAHGQIEVHAEQPPAADVPVAAPLEDSRWAGLPSFAAVNEPAAAITAVLLDEW